MVRWGSVPRRGWEKSRIHDASCDEEFRIGALHFRENANVHQFIDYIFCRRIGHFEFGGCIADRCRIKGLVRLP